MILSILYGAVAESDGLSDAINIFDEDEKLNIVEQVIPFDVPNVTNILLDLFERSVNSREEKGNLIFSDLVDKAKTFSISSSLDIDEDFDKNDVVPEEYRNIKLTVDKNGEIRVPNLFEVKKRPEIPSLLQQYLKRRRKKILVRKEVPNLYKDNESNPKISKNTADAKLGLQETKKEIISVEEPDIEENIKHFVGKFYAHVEMLY